MSTISGAKALTACVQTLTLRRVGRKADYRNSVSKRGAKMRNLWLALTALIALFGLQAPNANAVPMQDFELDSNCMTCLSTHGETLLTTIPQGGGSYLITAAVGLTILPTGSSPLTPSNDNLLFHPATSVFDQGGWVAYPTGFPSSLAFLDACGSFTGFSGCAVIYSDPHAIDGYIHPATFSVTPTPLPAALPLFATGLGALGLFGWRKKRKAAAALAAV